jgi:bifunctional DNase/RNase
MTDDAMIAVRLARIVLREDSPQQWIHLQEQEGERGFPIVIGLSEASEIRRVLHGDTTPRPLTHQLAQGLIDGLGATLRGVDIVDLRDNTFYAELVLDGADGEEVRIDARPSDALALGLRSGCTLRVAESVLEQVRLDKGNAGPDPQP